MVQRVVGTVVNQIVVQDLHVTMCFSSDKMYVDSLGYGADLHAKL